MAESRKVERGRWREPERSAVGICTKYTLFLENFLLVFVGLAATALGSYILVVKDKKVHTEIDFFLDPACDMCLAGGIVFVMGFLGSYGALRENTCCLRLYYFLLCLFLLGELALACVMFAAYNVPEMKGNVFPVDTFRHAMKNYRDDPDLEQMINAFQEDLMCCGIDDSETGYLDWNDNIYFNCTDKNPSPERCSVPYSCCRKTPGENINYQCGANVVKYENGKVVPNTLRLNNIYTDGCLRALGNWINDNSLIVGGVMLGVLLPQVFIVTLTRNLIDMINIQKSRWK